MATGGGAAYQRLQKPNEAISEGLKHWGSIAARQAEAQRGRNERNQVREMNRQERLDDTFRQDINALKPVITGVRSVDEINYRAVSNAQQRMGDIYREFKRNPASRTDVALNMELSNLRNFPETLSKVENKLVNYTKNLSEGFATGKYSKWDEDKLDELEAFFGVEGPNGKVTPNYIIDFDDQGNMVAKALKKDGTYFEKSINDVLNGFEYNDATVSTDAKDYVSDVAKGLGKRQELKIRNGFQTIVQDFGSQEENVRDLISTALGTPDEPSDLAKSIWSDENNMDRDRSEFNEKSLKEIEDYLVRGVEANYDQTIQARQLRKPDGPSDRDKARGSIQLMKNSSTGEPLKEYTSPNDKNEYSLAFSLAEPVTTGVGNKEKKINRLYLANDGTILFKGQEAKKQSPKQVIQGITIGGTGGKETVYEPVTGGGLDSQELNVIANRLGFDNALNLRKHLQEEARKEGAFQTNPDRGILD